MGMAATRPLAQDNQRQAGVLNDRSGVNMPIVRRRLVVGTNGGREISKLPKNGNDCRKSFSATNQEPNADIGFEHYAPMV